MRKNIELGNNNTSFLTYLLNKLKSQLKTVHKPGLFGNSRRLIEALASEWFSFFANSLSSLSYSVTFKNQWLPNKILVHGGKSKEHQTFSARKISY